MNRVIVGLILIMLFISGCQQDNSQLSEKKKHREEIRKKLEEMTVQYEKQYPGVTKAQETAKQVMQQLNAANSEWGKMNCTVDDYLRTESSGWVYNKFKYDAKGNLIGIHAGSRLFTTIGEKAPLRDLTPLADLPLQTVELYGEFEDISAFRKMQLKSLKIHNYKKVLLTDLTPIAECPVQTLYLENTEVSDLSALKNMPLYNVRIWKSPVRDISVLRGKQLIYLSLNDTLVSDLSPLEEMKISVISFKNTPAEKFWTVIDGQVKRK